MIIKIMSLGRINGEPYEAVIDTHEKHISDMTESALEKMLTNNQRDYECYFGPFRLRIKARRKMYRD